MKNQFLYILFSLFLLAPIHTSAMNWFKKKSAAPTEVYPTRVAVCSAYLGNETVWIPVEEENYSKISTTESSIWHINLRDKELAPLWKMMLRIGWKNDRLEVDDQGNNITLSISEKYPHATIVGAFITGGLLFGTLGYWFNNKKQ